MEKYYKTNLININGDFYKNDIDFQIIEWWAQDEENENENEDENETEEISEETDNKINSSYVIRCFGVTKTGISITCKITNFKPFYYIKVPDSFNRVHLHHFLKYIESGYMLRNFKNPLAKDNGKYLSSIVERKDLFGFRNGKRYKYVKLVFNNYTSLMKSRYLFKKAITIENVTKKPTKFKLYESNFEPFMRYCHIKDILMAGWVRLPKGKFKSTQDTSTTQVEVEIDKRDIVSLREYQDMANFLQASWDIEVYSHDRTFPDPKLKIKRDGEIVYPNEIFQIATTYKYTNSSDVLVKHLLTLKRCEPINEANVVVEECKSERELIKRWSEIISKMDPDIFYTYNGDSFDCIYLIERAVLCGLASMKQSGSKKVYSGHILSNLSRLTIKQAEIKEEYFSSSAYGDSKFNRIYIPGRLNYDLLIHYKRGMKKYSSYKLDNIASEILKQNKHDVSAKDMFNLYERGLPEDIKKIGLYCLQDTLLLQNLVDKQLILTNIMQLANVTFVPIGFLTTRGQTIKVFSQILRKARQMDFLVPHTNFNEDSFSITLKMKEPDVFTDEDIGQYIEIDLGLVKNAEGSKTTRKSINAKVSEVIDETTVVILSDTEIFEEYYNRKLKYRRQEHMVSRLFTNDDEIDSSFTGATVLEPVPGMYLDDNIAVLDFASLYPTIMISRNLCYSTFVLDDKYLNEPDVNYEKIAWNDNIEYKLKHTCEAIGKSGKTKGEICGKQAYFEIDNKYYCRIHDLNKKTRSSDEKFQKRNVDYKYTIVQPHTDSEGNVLNKGVLPALLEELYAERKRVKREMVKAAADGNKLLESILDSTQLAIKVSLNSTYGFLGRGQGNLILKELGSIVTSVGRLLIEQTKEYAEGPFLEYIKESGVSSQRLEYQDYKLSDQEKRLVLKQFQI
jgi:DNA polymerase elongation subunit (family B)